MKLSEAWFDAEWNITRCIGLGVSQSLLFCLGAAHLAPPEVSMLAGKMFPHLQHSDIIGNVLVGQGGNRSSLLHLICVVHCELLCQSKMEVELIN